MYTRTPIEFDADLAPVDLEVVPDRADNGIPELAVLGPDPMRVEVRDGLSGAAVGDATFTHYVSGQDLTIYPDLDGSRSPALAVLTDNRRPDHRGDHSRDLVRVGLAGARAGADRRPERQRHP